MGRFFAVALYFLFPPSSCFSIRHFSPKLHFDVEVVDIRIEDRPPLSVFFANMDEDQNGFVDQEEIQAFFKQMVGYFDDKDGDGMISWEEFSGRKGTTEPPPSRRSMHAAAVAADRNNNDGDDPAAGEL